VLTEAGQQRRSLGEGGRTFSCGQHEIANKRCAIKIELAEIAEAMTGTDREPAITDAGDNI
jgi:hypothetical protein